jgi:hypothetical protein
MPPAIPVLNAEHPLNARSPLTIRNGDRRTPRRVIGDMVTIFQPVGAAGV